MSAHTVHQTFSFQLPSLSYIDAKWEEPNLRAPTQLHDAARKLALVARIKEAIQARRQARQAVAEFAGMSDYELADIGLSRSDIHRVFNPAFNQDLRQRGRAA